MRAVAAQRQDRIVAVIAHRHFSTGPGLFADPFDCVISVVVIGKGPSPVAATAPRKRNDRSQLVPIAHRDRHDLGIRNGTEHQDKLQTQTPV